MLIGPTFTLAEFESKLKERLYQNMKCNSDANKIFLEAKQQIGLLPRLIEDEKTGQRVANPAYLKAVEVGNITQQELEDIVKQDDFIKAKLEELETIEERSHGAVDKNKEKITLTLNDCVAFGIELPGDDE